MTFATCDQPFELRPLYRVVVWKSGFCTWWSLLFWTWLLFSKVTEIMSMYVSKSTYFAFISLFANCKISLFCLHNCKKNHFKNSYLKKFRCPSSTFIVLYTKSWLDRQFSAQLFKLVFWFAKQRIYLMKKKHNQTKH